MRILSIETSCDETAVAVLEADVSSGSAARFTVLGNALLSQIDIHREFGGVYPAVAKREHAKHIVPLMRSSLEEASMLVEKAQDLPEGQKVTELLAREEGLAAQLLAFAGAFAPPELDAIAVTSGPGLEPALWVGVNFAKALSMLWDVPLVSVNHMEGHVCAALTSIDAEGRLSIPEVSLPLLSLLISGGHTELVLSKEWGSYELIGATRDDAVGEAFDKVARMLGLQYPGGPEVSKLAEQARASGRENNIKLPRPMINDPHCDFSFSGLKTAVLYLVKDRDLSDAEKEDIARAFEDAAAEVLYAKTVRALDMTGARTLALGGGVSANTHIKRVFRERLAQEYPDVALAIPAPSLTTDNAIMIGMAGAYHASRAQFADIGTLAADGNLALRA
jgi:N6-L-threonylcarbamoyladenine synthase